MFHHKTVVLSVRGYHLLECLLQHSGLSHQREAGLLQHIKVKPQGGIAAIGTNFLSTFRLCGYILYDVVHKICL